MCLYQYPIIITYKSLTGDYSIVRATLRGASIITYKSLTGDYSAYSVINVVNES